MKLKNLLWVVCIVFWTNTIFAEKIDRRKLIKIPEPISEKSSFSKKNRHKSSDLYGENRNLRRRIRTLERAVIQLQSWVIELSRDQKFSKHDRDFPSKKLKTSKASKRGRYACLIDGKFLGKGATRLEAKANAIKACERTTSFCSTRGQKLECEKSAH